MTTSQDIWQNPEWLAWISDRPPEIQELARQYPPDRPYRVQGGVWPGYIISYSEFEEGGVGFMCEISDPLFPRQVFGLKPEDLEPWPEDMPLDPWGFQDSIGDK